MIGQLIFVLLLVTAVVSFYLKAKKIYANIQLGKPITRKDNPNERWKQVLLIALGQKKMFQKPIPALLHLFVYLGFLFVNIELLEIVLDGILGTHRLFAPALGSLYPILINFFEFFAVAVIVTCTIFLIRRNIIKVERFHKAEMTKWPKLDGNLILIFEIALMGALLKMNASDTILHQSEGYFFSNLLLPALSGFSLETLAILERVYWWFHIVGVFFFANYVLYSKHQHIFLAFPSTYFANLNSLGAIENMASVTNEVKIMLGMANPSNEAPTEVGRFGAKDVKDLNQVNLLNAMSCTECGRCTANCPANITGKKLSPRKIMMDTRDRLEEYSLGIEKNGKDYDDGKSLLGNYITDEELFACTTCNACTQACPINLDPLNIIIQLRQYKVMEEAQGPSEWNMMYQNIETSFSPWKFSPSDRFKWKENLNK